MNMKIQNAINRVLELIEKEELEKVALAVFRGNCKPSDKWSFFNRLIMLMNNTADARGFRQWESVGRRVKKGAKAFHILAPIHKKVPVKVRREEDGDEETEEIIYVDKLVGFKAVPVFRYEDTEGKPLPEENFNVNIPCEFDGIINELGLRITTKAFNGQYYGCYIPMRKEIELASPEIVVFLHELAHAVDDRLHNLNGDREEREFVAEISAAVIGYLLGYRIDYRQVKYYTHSFNKSTIFSVLNRIGRVVSYIIDKTSYEIPNKEITSICVYS